MLDLYGVKSSPHIERFPTWPREQVPGRKANEMATRPSKEGRIPLTREKILDKAGKDSVKPNTAVRVSTTHTAWFNTPETIKKTWPYLFQSGVKLNRT